MNLNDINLHFSSFIALWGSYLVCLGVRKTRANEVRARELGMVQVSTRERGTFRVRAWEQGTGRVRARERGTGRVRVRERETGERGRVGSEGAERRS